MIPILPEIFIHPETAGNIHVEWRKRELHIELTLTVPDGTQAEIVLPNVVPIIVGAGTPQITNK
jgi:hypothetical protein